MDELVPSVPRVAADSTAEEGGGWGSALIGAGLGAGFGLLGGGPVGAVVGAAVGGAGGMGWLDFLGRPSRTLIHTGDAGQAWDSIWDSSKAATEQDLLNDIGWQPMDEGEGFDMGDVSDFAARMAVGMVTDPLTYVNPGALTAKGALRKTTGYNTLSKYYKELNAVRAEARKSGMGKRELEELMGTTANRISAEHNADAVARELAHGLEPGSLGRLDDPFVREYKGVAATTGEYNPLKGPTDASWKEAKTIEQQLGNFGLGETLSDRIKRGEQWSIGFGLPWGHEKAAGLQMDKVVDFLSDKGSTLETALTSTGTGRWVADRIKTVREYIFNPIRENAFEELKRASVNIPWKVLKEIEVDHTKLFEDIKSKKLNAEEYGALTELASWDRLGKAGNENAATKAAAARAVFKDPERAAWAAGAAGKIRDIEGKLLTAMQDSGVDVQDMRAVIEKQHSAFLDRYNQIMEKYSLAKGDQYAAAKLLDQASDAAHKASWDEATRQVDDANRYAQDLQRVELEKEAKSRFDQAVKSTAKATELSPEEVSLGIRKMALAWQEKTGGDLTEFYRTHMPTDPAVLSEWAKLGRAKETPAPAVSATVGAGASASPSPAGAGTELVQARVTDPEALMKIKMNELLNYYGEMSEDIYGSGLSGEVVNRGISGWKRLRAAVAESGGSDKSMFEAGWTKENAADPLQAIKDIETAHKFILDNTGGVKKRDYKTIGPSSSAKATSTQPAGEVAAEVAKRETGTASSDLLTRLSAVRQKDVSEEVWFVVDNLKKAKDSKEAAELIRVLPKESRPEFAKAVGLDPNKNLTAQVQSEFARAKSSGASAGKGTGSAAEVTAEQAAKAVANKPVVKEVAPINDTELAHSLFRTLPETHRESTINRVAQGVNQAGETVEQWAARQPALDEAVMRTRYAKETANLTSDVPEFNDWLKNQPEYKPVQKWLSEKPADGIGNINRQGYEAYHSYVENPQAMLQARVVASDPEAAKILERQAADYKRTKDAIIADPDIKATLEKLKNTDAAAPAPTVKAIEAERPRRMIDVKTSFGTVRQPWAMTADEWSQFVQSAKDKSGEYIPTSRIVDEHVSLIKNAINRGEHVSPKVLQSYPEIADFQPSQVMGSVASKTDKVMEGGAYWLKNQDNARSIPHDRALSAQAVKNYYDLQADLLRKTSVLGERARSLELAEKTSAMYKKLLDETPEHLHAMLTPEALEELVKNGTFKRALAGSDKGLLRKFSMIGRPLSIVEMNQMVKEQDRAGQLLALGGRLPQGKLGLGDLMAAMHPDEATFTQWAKHSLPAGATEKQISEKAKQLKALPAKQRIQAVSQAYGKLFDERPEVALAASIENASKLISNAQFNEGLRNLFTRKAPVIRLPEADDIKAYNRTVKEQANDLNRELSDIGRKMKEANAELKKIQEKAGPQERIDEINERISALKEDRKRAKQDLKLLKPEPTRKTVLSAPEPNGERWVSAEALGPQFKGREMKEGVYNQALKYLEMKNSPMAFEVLISMMRTPTRWYKQLQLSWPGSWIRDMMGNKLLRIQNQGIHSQTALDSPKLIQVLTSNGDEKALSKLSFTFQNWQGSGKAHTINGKQLWDMATENGIHGVDQYAIEIGKQIRGQGGAVSKVANTVFGKPRQFLQDMDRLEMFHARLSHGDAIGEAAARTNLALYDYRSVSPFVDMMRTSGMMPFATWMAKNIPAQFELFVRHPGQFAGLMHAKAAVEQGVPGVSDKDLPSYLDKHFNVILGKTSDGKVIFRTLDGVVPMADLPALGKMSVGDWLQNALGPVPKLVIEEITNRDTFSGKMIEKYNGQLSPLSENIPLMKDVLVPVRAKRRLQVAIGRPLTVAEEFAGWDAPKGALQRPKDFLEHKSVLGALVGISPEQTDPRINALNRNRERQAEANRALSDAAYYRRRGQFAAAEAAQKRAMEIQRGR